MARFDSSNRKRKPVGTPFAAVSGKPWTIRPRDGWGAFAAMTVTIFFRRDFGERYLEPASLGVGMFPLFFFAIGMRAWAGGGIPRASFPVPPLSWMTWLIFCVAFLSYASWQNFASVNRRSVFPDEFSYSDGRPREGLFRFMPFMRDEWDFERYYEPLICVVLGFLLTYFHDWFGVYLIIAGYCAYSVAKTKHEIRRELELNSLDGRTVAATQPDFSETENEQILPIDSRTSHGQSDVESQ